MLIGGILQDAGMEVTLARSAGPCEEKILLLSLYSTQHLLDRRIRDCVKQHRENGGLCYAGGPASTAPEMVLGELGVDAVVVGEGENAIVPLVRQGVSAEIPGIAYRDGDRIVIQAPVPPANLRRPLPLIPDDIGSQSIRGANAYIESHRGCLVGAIPANNRWYQKSVEPYAYLPMSGRHRPTDTFAGGDWHCGRWAECC